MVAVTSFPEEAAAVVWIGSVQFQVVHLPLSLSPAGVQIDPVT